MAIYRDLTQKQLDLLEPMTKEAAVYKRKADELKAKLSQRLVNINFDDNQRLRKMERDFRRKYEDKQAEINNILCAKEEYEYCLSKANSYCQRAESLKNTWGFE